MFEDDINQSIHTIKDTTTNTFIKNRQTFIILFDNIFNRFFGIFCEIRIPPSMKMLRKLLGIHFTTRVAPTTVRRENNNGTPKFWVDTDGETENTTTLSPARKEWLCYHKGGRNTALEAEAQLYSDNIT